MLYDFNDTRTNKFNINIKFLLNNKPRLTYQQRLLVNQLRYSIYYKSSYIETECSLYLFIFVFFCVNTKKKTQVEIQIS